MPTDPRVIGDGYDYACLRQSVLSQEKQLAGQKSLGLIKHPRDPQVFYTCLRTHLNWRVENETDTKAALQEFKTRGCDTTYTVVKHRIEEGGGPPRSVRFALLHVTEMRDIHSETERHFDLDAGSSSLLFSI